MSIVTESSKLSPDDAQSQASLDIWFTVALTMIFIAAIAIFGMVLAVLLMVCVVRRRRKGRFESKFDHHEENMGMQFMIHTCTSCIFS